MPLKRTTMTVYLTDDDQGVEVEAINPDFLRAENELPKVGLSGGAAKSKPMHYMTVVAWAAMKRVGQYDGKLQAFLYEDCQHLDVHKQKGDDDDSDDVPPTDAAHDTP